MSSGKSGVGQTSDYYGTIACGLAIGPIDDLIGIILDGQAVWPQGKIFTIGTAMSITAGQLYVFDAQSWVAQQTFNVPANVQNTDSRVPGNDASYWLEYTMPRPATDTYSDIGITTSDDTFYGNCRFYWGTDAQTVDYYLTTAWTKNQQHPNYEGVALAIPYNFLLGQEVQAAPNLQFIIRRAPDQSVVTGAPATITDGQCNLAAWAAELLTSANGIGLPSAALDPVSFNNVAAYLQTNEALYGASPLIDRADTLRSVLDQLTQMIDGYIRYNPDTKLIEMGIYQHGQTPAVYTTLTEDSLTERPQLKSSSWQDTYSRATVRFCDRQLSWQETSVHCDDPRVWAVLKTVREISLDRPWITRAAQALLHGRETLRVIGHAQTTGTLTVRREIGRTIRAGDYVLLDVDIEPNIQTIYQFFRVTKRTIPMTGPIKIEVSADNTLAPVPWLGSGTPIVPDTNNVDPVTNFRIVEAPTALAGGVRGSIIPLVQRPDNIVTSCNLNFDLDPTGGTFPLLGVFTGFAAKGVLHANIGATDSTITVDADTTQPDADFFTQQYTSNQQKDDTMLAFIVQTISDPGQPDDDQIAESNGYALMEICSVGAITLVGAGQYQLSVLRGRQNTFAAAFNSANSEVWLIPRSNVASFVSTLFAQLRANRLLNTTPIYGYFRFCPSTFVATYPLADAISEPFRFALNSASAPSLILSTPTGALNITGAVFPKYIKVAGTWNDPDGNLVQVKIQLLKSTDTSPRTFVNKTIAPQTSLDFTTWIQIDKAGTYTLMLIARDSTNLLTEVDIPITIAGGGAKCAMPDCFDINGDQLLQGSGNSPKSTGTPNTWSVSPLRLVPYGALTLQCNTPGAQIVFWSNGPIHASGKLVLSGAQATYQPGTTEPFCMPADPGTGIMDTITVSCYAIASGYGQSDTIQFIIPIAIT